jgi:hypothetical protein
MLDVFVGVSGFGVSGYGSLMLWNSCTAVNSPAAAGPGKWDRTSGFPGVFYAQNVFIGFVVSWQSGVLAQLHGCQQPCSSWTWQVG